jgi:hypothetical protein
VHQQPLKRTEQAMKQILITIAMALGLGFLSTPSFATGYIVNGHAASPAEAQHLVANVVQQGAWVVNGYGLAPAERASFTSAPTTQPSGKNLTCCSATDREAAAHAGTSTVLFIMFLLVRVGWTPPR